MSLDFTVSNPYLRYLNRCLISIIFASISSLFVNVLNVVYHLRRLCQLILDEQRVRVIVKCCSLWRWLSSSVLWYSYSDSFWLFWSQVFGGCSSLSSRLWPGWLDFSLKGIRVTILTKVQKRVGIYWALLGLINSSSVRLGHDTRLATARRNFLCPPSEVEGLCLLTSWLDIAHDFGLHRQIYLRVVWIYIYHRSWSIHQILFQSYLISLIDQRLLRLLHLAVFYICIRTFSTFWWIENRLIIFPEIVFEDLLEMFLLTLMFL